MNATDRDWQEFTRRLAYRARRGGLRHDQAEDVAQSAALAILEGRLARGARDLDHALAVCTVIARRAGTWAALDPAQDRERYRYLKGLTGPGAVLPVREATAAYPSPEQMLMAAEAKGFPASRVLEVYGLGPYAVQEVGTVPPER